MALLLDGTTGITASGNITGANFLTTGLISTSGNVEGANGVFTSVEFSSSITGNAALLTDLNASELNTGTVPAARLTGSYNIDVTTANTAATVTTAAQPNITSVGTLTSLVSTGNITTANLISTGVVDCTGNVTGGNIISSGEITAVGTVSGGDLSTLGNVDAGSLFVSVLGGIYELEVDTTANVVGNIDGGNVNSAGEMLAVGNITGGNIVSLADVTTVTVTASGNIISGNIETGGVLTVNTGNSSQAILNGGGNAVGNIGTLDTRFDTLFAVATNALYADLAEMYASDYAYSAGTVVSFGGEREITLSLVQGDTRVAGVVSTNPCYLMNAGLVAETRVAVALSGRVPTRVTGTVRKGDMMVSNGDGTARAESNPQIGSVIGKSLEEFHGSEGIIEIVVGRL